MGGELSPTKKIKTGGKNSVLNGVSNLNGAISGAHLQRES
jgi:hypothetical protein